MAHGSSRAWSRIRAAGLSHSHSNTGSKPHLQPTPQLAAMARSLTHRARPGIKPASSPTLGQVCNSLRHMGTWLFAISLSLYTPSCPTEMPHNMLTQTHHRTSVFSLLWFYKFHSPLGEYFPMRLKLIVHMRTRGKVDLSRPIKVRTAIQIMSHQGWLQLNEHILTGFYMLWDIRKNNQP